MLFFILSLLEGIVLMLAFKLIALSFAWAVITGFFALFIAWVNGYLQGMNS